ncbi:MAG: ABC transporter ATP-binding protein [Spirochaetes bacterium]|nr:ABC transporter ATP-binding protein [Spirochaetota bacterium]
MNETILSYDSVTKRFGTLTAVDNVSFSVKKGECVALLGPNGAGKTTLVRLLLDFTRASDGAVTINGVPSTNPRARESIGYLPENVRIPAHLTCYRYLMRCARLLGIPPKDAPARCHAVIENVGMKGKENVPLGTCSKGMAQRIALAAALVGDPHILILDEPTSGLDPIGIREIRVILESLKAKGMTILLNSHLLSEVEKVCDAALIIDRGKVLVKDTIAAIVKDGESLEDVFVRLVTARTGASI